MTINYEHYHTFSTEDGGYLGATAACKKAVGDLTKHPGYSNNDEWNQAIADVVKTIEILERNRNGRNKSGHERDD